MKVQFKRDGQENEGEEMEGNPEFVISVLTTSKQLWEAWDRRRDSAES